MITIRAGNGGYGTGSANDLVTLVSRASDYAGYNAAGGVSQYVKAPDNNSALIQADNIFVFGDSLPEASFLVRAVNATTTIFFENDTAIPSRPFNGHEQIGAIVDGSFSNSDFNFGVDADHILMTAGFVYGANGRVTDMLIGQGVTDPDYWGGVYASMAEFNLNMTQDGDAYFVAPTGENFAPYTSITGMDFDVSEFNAAVYAYRTGNTAPLTNMLLGQQYYFVGSEGGRINSFSGGNLDDEMVGGTNANNYFSGGAGNDTLRGGGRENQLSGGAGNDEIWGGSYVPTLEAVLINQLDGGDGDDLIHTGILGNRGSTRVDAGADNDTVFLDDITANGYFPIPGGNYALSGFILDGGAGRDTLVLGDAITIDWDFDSTVLTDLLQPDGVTTQPAYLADWVKNFEVFKLGSGNDRLAMTQSGTQGYELHGGAGDDSLVGGRGDDFLYGDEGTDTLLGGDGNDWLRGGLGDDTLNGGNGTDTADFSYDVTFGRRVDLVAGTATRTASAQQASDLVTAGPDTDRLLSIENATGTQQDDVFIGRGTNWFQGLGGDDTFFTDSRDATIEGGEGTDTWHLASGGIFSLSDTIDLGAGTSKHSELNLGGGGIGGGAFTEYTIQFIGIEKIYAGDGDDHFIDGLHVLPGGVFDVTAVALYGEAGNDTFDIIQGFPDNRLFDGGDGIDTISFAGWDANDNGLLDIELDVAGIGLARWADPTDGTVLGAALKDFEIVVGSHFADRIVTAVGAELHAGDGNDRLLVSQGAFYGGYFFDGGADDDSLSLDGFGAIAGNLGLFAGFRGLDIDLGRAGSEMQWTSTFDGQIYTSRIIDVEHITGSQGADTMRGVFETRGLSGGRGADTLYASPGDQLIDGGADADIAVFTGRRGDYEISYDAATSTLTVAGKLDTAGYSDGVDGLVNVETLRFADGDVAAQQLMNAAPTVAIAHVETTIAENGAAQKVGDIAVVDDGQGSNDLALTGSDAADFSIRNGSELWFNGGADFETKQRYDIAVTVDDFTVGGSPDATIEFSLGITNVNEAPVAVAITGATTERTAYAGHVAATDVDGDGLSYRLVGLVSPAGVTFGSDGNFTVAPVPSDLAMNFGDSRVVTFQYVANDGLLDSAPQLVSITIDGRDDDILGTPNDDPALDGSDGPDTIRGLAGHDVIDGKGGDDILFGNADIFAQESDTLRGGAGDDTIHGEFTDTIDGGTGADTLIADNSYDWTIDLATTSIEAFYAAWGNDSIDATGQSVGVTVYSSGGDDTVLGSAHGDTIWLGVGDDTAHGGDGDDVIVGEGGADHLFGDGGNDSLYVDDADTFDGGAGTDALCITVGGGVTIDMDATHIEWVGDYAGGADLITAAAGVDAIVYAGNGADEIAGLDGRDFLWGEAGDDLVVGGAGNDTLVGGGGADTLRGDAGSDTIFANSGGGGDGAVDTIAFNAPGWGTDFVYDFEDGTDKIDMRGSGATSGALTITDVAGHAYVSFGGTDLIVVVGQGATLTAGDFLL